jgi:hypothetical protein
MKLLTITRFNNNEIVGFVELKDEYAEFRLTREKMPEYLNAFPKVRAPGEYGQTLRLRDYEHFVGLCSKFMPYTTFLEKPFEIELLDFDVLLKICEEYP